jgi:hypothetical protein
MRSLPLVVPSVVLALFAGTTASAGVPEGTAFFQGWATADNALAVSISTSPTTAGTPVFSGDSWGTTYNGQLLISTPGTYYLQVRAQDFGQPEMFIGRFTLSGFGQFANGTQELVTNPSDWVVSTSGFGVATTAPAVLGPNGAGPWGNFPQMGTGQFIWAPQYVDGIAYFTAVFTVTPTPGAATALGIGGLLAARRRRA